MSTKTNAAKTGITIVNHPVDNWKTTIVNTIRPSVRSIFDKPIFLIINFQLSIAKLSLRVKSVGSLTKGITVRV